MLIQVFVGGAAVMSVELLGSRLLAPHFGNTLYVWGSLIGIVMTALAAGAYVGGMRADANPTPQRLARILFASGLAIGAIPLVSPFVLSYTARLVLDPVLGPLLVTLILLGPCTFLLGMATPLAIRLKTARVERVGHSSGNVYALSTAGSILGTFATAFFLIPNVRVSLLFTLTALLVCLVALLGLRQKTGGVLLVTGLLLLSPSVASSLERSLAGPLLDGEVVYETQSAYQRIRVVEDSNPFHMDHVRSLYMDNLRHSSTYTNRPNESASAYVYYFHLGTLLTGEPSRVLFLGAGGFSAPKKFLEAYPNATLDVVELDEEVVRVAQEYFFAPVDDSRVRVHVMDGRAFLRQAEEASFDLIVLDAYSRTYIPFHLLTVEFFRLVESRLAPGGAVVSNIIASTLGPSSEILRAEVRTVQQALSATYLFPVGGARGLFAQNVILVAQRGEANLTKEDWVERAHARSSTALPALASYAQRLHEPLDVSAAPILWDDFSAVETLLNPVTRQPYEGD